MNFQYFNRRESLKSLAALGAAGTLGAFSQHVHAQKPITVGVIYVGPRDDYGYNQAQAQAAAEIKKMPGIKVVEEENVPETAAVQKTMTGMIVQDGASLVFATSLVTSTRTCWRLRPSFRTRVSRIAGACGPRANTPGTPPVASVISTSASTSTA